MSGLMTLMLEIGVLLAIAAGLFFTLGWWARGLKGETSALPASEQVLEEPPPPAPDLTDTVIKLEQEVEALHTRNVALSAEIESLRQETAATETPAKPKRPRKKKS
jgi:cell division protein FtsB